ncbi:helix-turn-helix domain-containing protein [Solimonas sp. SE-A11]|uniref:helix-turn-helix domain-containing protein n=1 Tax=Solimonas sp. SE-A11 TaxID=3054954 RepID=UPI003460FA7C
MSKKSVTARIYLAGSSPSEIAEALDITRSAVSRVIHGRGTSERVATHIADLLDSAPSRLWPGKYQSQSRRSA